MNCWPWHWPLAQDGGGKGLLSGVGWMFRKEHYSQNFPKPIRLFSAGHFHMLGKIWGVSKVEESASGWI